MSGVCTAIKSFFTVSDVSTPIESLIAAVAAVSAGAVLVRIIANHPLPSCFTPTLTLDIQESDGPIYDAVDRYLSTLASTATIAKGKKITDHYWGCRFTWTFVPDSNSQHGRSFRVTFHGKYKEIALRFYLPSISNRYQSSALSHRNHRDRSMGLGLGLELYTNDEHDQWRAVHLQAATFESVAVEPPERKWEVKNDLVRFLSLKEYYKRGRLDEHWWREYLFHGRLDEHWRREYLLRGAPGADKSGLIAAMANLLRYDVYVLSLSQVKSLDGLWSLFMGIHCRSIMVVRLEKEGKEEPAAGVTVTEVFKFIDGLLFSRGDERIVVYTMSYKEILDQALLQCPGRIRMDIYMSNNISCTPDMFRILACSYLRISDHPLFSEIERLLREVHSSPDEVEDELSTNTDIEIILRGLIKSLLMKKVVIMTHVAQAA